MLPSKPGFFTIVNVSAILIFLVPAFLMQSERCSLSGQSKAWCWRKGQICHSWMWMCRSCEPPHLKRRPRTHAACSIEAKAPGRYLVTPARNGFVYSRAARLQVPADAGIWVQLSEDRHTSATSDSDGTCRNRHRSRAEREWSAYRGNCRRRVPAASRLRSVWETAVAPRQHLSGCGYGGTDGPC